MRNDRNIIQRKMNITELGKCLFNVAEAYKRLSLTSHDNTDIKNTLREVGIERFLELVKAKTKHPKPSGRISKDIEDRILAYTLEFPTHGQDRVSSEMKRKGIVVSAGTVRGIWLKYRLERKDQRIKHQQQLGKSTDSPHEKRREAEEEKAASALGGKPQLPAYLLAQDTYFIGYAKGVGKIYQQTGIDFYSGVAFAKLYNDRTSLTAADLLNDKVLPFFDSYGLRVQRIVTDLGTEFCGISESHPYEVFLHINDIEHIRSKSASLETLSKIDKLNLYIQKSFYDVVLRTRSYSSLSELQHDLDTFMSRYNDTHIDIEFNEIGETPMEKFLAGIRSVSEHMS
ncbi:transposase family protein [Oligoflexus tunisiensis]|uniref:transposase family protein n=1 Tax=Oligoflexus tunisiensis TaxID=708132 RepID=UPI000B0C63B7|nr:transposase family protein [Oligoflexus tunisiensis]